MKPENKKINEQKSEYESYASLEIVLITGRSINIKCDIEKAVTFFVNFQTSKTWNILEILTPFYLFRASEIAMVCFEVHDIEKSKSTSQEEYHVIR